METKRTKYPHEREELMEWLKDSLQKIPDGCKHDFHALFPGASLMIAMERGIIQIKLKDKKL